MEDIANNDFVFDASLCGTIPIVTPAGSLYAKVGCSKYISVSKRIDANYLHAGLGG